MRMSPRRDAGRLWAGLALALMLAAPRGYGQSAASYTLPPPANAVEAMRLSYYAYDRALPLNAELKPLDETSIRTRYSLSYDSVHDQRVTAILAIPRRFAAPHPAVLIVHGSGGNKSTNYVEAASEILTLQGFATLAIDTQYRGDRARPGRTGEITPDSYLWRDAWIQTVVDLRRALDYLESRPAIDKSKFGFLGFSMGAMLGAVLGGVEPRLTCFYLAVPGGGFVNLVKHIDRYPVLKERFSVQVTPEVLQRVEDIAGVTDPIYFVGRILPRPLMIVVATHDEIIPPEASAALIEAAHAKEPETVKRLNSGHVPNPIIAFDIRDFFLKHLGREGKR